MEDFSADTIVHYAQGDDNPICGRAIRSFSDDFAVRNDIEFFDSVPGPNKCWECVAYVG